MARKRWDIIAGLIKHYDLEVGAEVGVKRGRNIEMTLSYCPDFHWIAVDPWDENMQYQTWDKSSHSKHEALFDDVVKRFPNSITKIKEYSVEAAAQVDDQSLDLVFIDATHTYEDCLEDILAWLPKLKEGGIMSGHDYHHPRFPGVTDAVDEMFTSVRSDADYFWWVKV